MSKTETNAGNYIPASQRPDGTWRKPRRVKEGYVPQEEVPLYESKGKQLLNRKPQAANQLPSNLIPHDSVPGLFVEVKKSKKEKKHKVDEVVKSIEKIKIYDKVTPTEIDPAKRLKNLRKRLREIEALELKINAGDIKNPEKEQLEKVARKKEVIKEIRTLEAKI